MPPIQTFQFSVVLVAVPSPFQSVLSDLTLDQSDLLRGQITAPDGPRQGRSSAQRRSAAFDVRRDFVQTQNSVLPFGEMHLFRSEYHETPYLDPLQRTVLFQDLLQRPYVALVL